MVFFKCGKPPKKIEKLATWKYEVNIMHTILETCFNLFRGYYNLKYPSGLSWWGRGVIWLGETSMDVPWLWLGNIGNMMGWKSVGNPSLYVRYGSHNMFKEVCVCVFFFHALFLGRIGARLFIQGFLNGSPFWRIWSLITHLVFWLQREKSQARHVVQALVMCLKGRAPNRQCSRPVGWQAHSVRRKSWLHKSGSLGRGPPRFFFWCETD